MDLEITLPPGSVLDWKLLRQSMEVEYSMVDQTKHRFGPVKLKKFLSRMSKRTRTRVLSLLKAPSKEHRGKGTLIFDLDVSRRAIVHVDVTSCNDSEVVGHACVQSIIPQQVDSEWILMSFLKDRRKGVVVADSAMNILCVNDHLLRTFSTTESNIVGQHISSLTNSAETKTAIERLCDSHKGEDGWGGVAEFLKHDGESTTQDIDIKKLYWCTESLVYLIRLTEVSGRQFNLSHEKEEHWQTTLEMPNKQALLEQVNQYECKDQVLLVACIQPDFFKSVRKEANRRLALALRQLTLPVTMARLEDGVYCVVAKLCPNNFKDTHAVTKVLRKLRKDLKSNVHDLIYRDIVNGLWGVDVYGVDGNTIEQVVDRAYQTMKIHDRRKSPYSFFNPELIEIATKEQQQTSLVLEAVRLRKLDIAYQPIVDLMTGKIHRFEALCRFRDAGKMFSVQSLIETAETLGVVHVLDKIVAEKALQGFTQIQQKFSGHQNISLNCSLVDSEEKLRIFDELCAVIQKFKPEHTNVTVEITESAYFDNSLMDSKEVIKARKNGIDIAVDDFGSGNSSFQYFNNLRFDCIKIDKSFISDIDTVRHKFLAVKMLTQLAHELNVKVVVEGVETVSELETVKSLSVDYVQGYIFSRPRPLNEILACDTLDNLIQNQVLNNGVIVMS
ncbi:EAL domain-containing protein [Vibrio astriarenae]